MTRPFSAISLLCVFALAGCNGQISPDSESMKLLSGGTQDVRTPLINDVPMSASGIDFATEWNDSIATEKILPIEHDVAAGRMSESSWSSASLTGSANTGATLTVSGATQNN